MKKVCILVWLTIFCSKLYAHQDTIIDFKGGELLGFPEEYSPALFDIESKTLRIGDKEMVFPSCLKKYFSTLEVYDLEFYGSWYHEPELLPPYLSMNIKFPDRFFGYELLFDIDQMNLIQVEVRTMPGDGFYMHKIEINKFCLEELRLATRKSNS